MLGVGGCRLVWCCLALSIGIRFGFHVDSSSQSSRLVLSSSVSRLDPTASRGDGQHDLNTPAVSFSAII